MTEDPTDIDHPHAERHGIIYASTAYLIWAVMPLYWNLLVAIPSVELATHRILWCAICVFAISLLRGRLSHLKQIVRNPKLLRTLMLTSVLITCNWTIFIYCVESHQLVAASLGYYITPLISIALGVALLGERITPVKIGAIALATAAVVWQAVELGYIPWVSPALAFSFGFYGYFRKLTPVDGVPIPNVEVFKSRDYYFALYLVDPDLDDRCRHENIDLAGRECAHDRVLLIARQAAVQRLDAGGCQQRVRAQLAQEIGDIR